MLWEQGVQILSQTGIATEELLLFYEWSGTAWLSGRVTPTC